jgi:ATP-dependent RNA helicase DHX34
LRESQSNLPIYKYHDTILETIKNNQITIIAGDTGCGKSTQLPRYLLEAGYDRIACTQPRRIACMSLAKRVGYETLNEFKSEVAFQVRFDKTRTKFTKILFLTEGVLLRQLQTDPTLSQYNFIVVDEVHERHVFTDFLLGILKCLIKQRTDLKIILMSATINIDLFSNYFDQCVIVKVIFLIIKC